MRFRAAGVGSGSLEPSELLKVLLTGLALAACGDSPTDVEPPATGCAGARPISVGESLAGDLSAGDCDQGGTLGDRWTLTLSAQTRVRIELSSSAFDAYLELRDGAGALLVSNDDAVGLNSRIVHTLAAGSYVIYARSFAPGQAGAYQLRVAETPECAAPGSIALGQTATGALASTDCVTEWDSPSDNWSFTLAAATRVRVELRSSAFDEVVVVRDPEGSILTGADWSHPSGHAQLDVDLGAGAWTVTAAGAPGSTGPYELKLDVAPACTPGTDVVFGQEYTGQMTGADCFPQSFLLPADSFRVAVAAETQVAVHLKSTDFSPLVFLRNQNGQDVIFGSDMMDDGNARISTALAPGAYALFVSGFPPNGSYALTVDVVACDGPTPIDFGRTVDGALGADDCMRAGGAFQESWEVVLANDTTARIDLTSAAFDAYLQLKDEDGTVLATDDDGGDGLNARIQQRLPAGTYEIVASSFSQGSTGPYQLAVNVPPPPSLGAPVDRESERKVATSVPPLAMYGHGAWSSRLLEAVGRRSKR